MKEFLNSAVTWSGLINVVAAWFILKSVFELIAFMVGRAYHAAHRRLVKKAIKRVMVIFSLMKGEPGKVKNDVHILEPSKRLNEILAERKREWLETIQATASKNKDENAIPIPG